MIKLIYGLLAALGLYSTTSQAVDYHELDRNRDGYISNDEAQEMPELAGQWGVSDTNQDGRINKSEFALFEISIREQFPVSIKESGRNE